MSTHNQKLVNIVLQEDQDRDLACDCCGKPADTLYVMDAEDCIDRFSLCLKLFLEQPNCDEMLDDYTARLKGKGRAA